MSEHSRGYSLARESYTKLLRYELQIIPKIANLYIAKTHVESLVQ